MTDYIVPAVICGILLYGLYRGVDLYDALTCGMKEGLKVCRDIFPAILTMLVAITMVRASGTIDLIAHFLAPAVEPLGMPADCLPLALLRPFSGSGGSSQGRSRSDPRTPACRLSAKYSPWGKAKHICRTPYSPRIQKNPLRSGASWAGF